MTIDLAAIAAAQVPKSCADCGRTFGSRSAYALAHDSDRCLPDHYFEAQLVQVDGVYVSRGTPNDVRR